MNENEYIDEESQETPTVEEVTAEAVNLSCAPPTAHLTAGRICGTVLRLRCRA